jgi:hypothetical protein
VVKGRRGPECKSFALALAEAKRTRKSEVEVAKDEIQPMRLGAEFCLAVLMTNIPILVVQEKDL